MKHELQFEHRVIADAGCILKDQTRLFSVWYKLLKIIADGLISQKAETLIVLLSSVLIGRTLDTFSALRDGISKRKGVRVFLICLRDSRKVDKKVG